jgi:hypothetical protein
VTIADAGVAVPPRYVHGKLTFCPGALQCLEEIAMYGKYGGIKTEVAGFVETAFRFR